MDRFYCQTRQDTTFCTTEGESTAPNGLFNFSRADWRVHFSGCWYDGCLVRIPEPAAIIPQACAQHYCPRQSAGRDRRAMEEAARALPLKRVTEPEDVAEAIGACVAHLRTATGTTVVIDGGRHLL